MARVDLISYKEIERNKRTGKGDERETYRCNLRDNTKGCCKHPFMDSSLKCDYGLAEDVPEACPLRKKSLIIELLEDQIDPQ